MPPNLTNRHHELPHQKKHEKIGKNGGWSVRGSVAINCDGLSNAAIAMQHHPGNIHQSVATPRYSATPWYVLIQLPNVIDTISKRWRSKKAFNTSPFNIFP